jgi:hypothetical protein
MSRRRAPPVLVCGWVGGWVSACVCVFAYGAKNKMYIHACVCLRMGFKKIGHTSCVCVCVCDCSHLIDIASLVLHERRFGQVAGYQPCCLCVVCV